MDGPHRSNDVHLAPAEAEGDPTVTDDTGSYSPASGHTASVPASLVLVQHAGHGTDEPAASTTEQPSPEEVYQMATTFMARTLAS